MYPRIICVLSILVVLGCHVDGLAAQEYREGFWIGVGMGAAHGQIDCSRCGPLLPDDPWEGGGGFGLYVAMGGTAGANLLVGGELNLYGKRNSAQQRDATLAGLLAVVQFYPVAAPGLYLKGGAGFGSSMMAGGGGLIESGGWAMQGGAGYDVHLRGRFALAPFANVVQIFSQGAMGRDQGAPAQGPRNPRYLQLGIGAGWY
jgi:hypothetical protein